MIWTLHFLGVGNAAAADQLGSSSAVIERDGAPALMIDCGQEALAAYQRAYGAIPPAVFITHVHMDHVAGLERLFFAARFDPKYCGRVRLYVPAAVVPHLQARVADYPGVLAEGGSNFWDAFQLVPVSSGFWHHNYWHDVFAVRHHAPGTAFGLRLRGALVYTGDTRPIPEVLSQQADHHELIAHDCGLIGNPSHSGLDDLEREYGEDLLRRLLLYHYGSVAEADAMQLRGYSVARAGQRVIVSTPAVPPVQEAA